MFALALLVLSLAVLVFGLVDIHRCPRDRIVFLDRVGWTFIVILLPFLGVILWFLVGKDRGDGSLARDAEGDDLGTGDDAADDSELDAAIEREIEFHENEARIRRLEAELKAKRDLDGAN